MEHAQYGRMRKGRCVTGSYGNIGCSVDVLPYLDSKCSGRNSCNVYIADPVLHKMQPCPKDLTSYLEAKHICISGKCSSPIYSDTLWNIFTTNGDSCDEMARSDSQLHSPLYSIKRPKKLDDNVNCQIWTPCNHNWLQWHANGNQWQLSSLTAPICHN